MRSTLSLLSAAAAVLCCATYGRAAGTRFDRVVIDDNFPGAYQVEVADVDGDGKPDVVAVGGATCAWYQNPSWKKRVVTGPKQTPGVISSATRDLDGDGKAEIAVAYDFEMNQPSRGKLLLARQGKTPDDGWMTEQVAEVPSVHRLRWGLFTDYEAPRTSSGKVTFEKRVGLAVAPIFGPSAKPPVFNEEPARVFVHFPEGAGAPGRWHRMAAGAAPVLHAIDVLDYDGDGTSDLFGASNLGVSKFMALVVFSGSPFLRQLELTPGATGAAPRRGASEIHVGRLRNGHRFLATLEPWHGTDVAVYLSEKPDLLKFGPRTVLDTSLKDGHALWVADVDGDGDDEVFAGYRGPGTSVLMFDFNGKTWDRSVVDDHIAAQDLRGGDLDGDGRPDVVAAGGSTHNVVWYRPRPAGR